MKDGTVSRIYHNFDLAPWMGTAWFWERENLSEIPGTENNPHIMEMHRQATNGWIPPNDDNQGPWCSSFACAMMNGESSYSGLYQDGFESPRNALSLSWLNWGVEISEPVYGAVAVKRRTGGGHVGFVVGQNQNGTRLAILGGNQNNSVNITSYSANIFRFFLPIGYSTPSYSRTLPIYQFGNQNNRTTEQ